MTSLIKSSSLAGRPEVRGFAALGAPVVPGELSREELLERRIEDLEASLAAARAELDEKVEEARKEGARDALQARSEAEGKSLEALREALDSARDDWSKRMDSWAGASAGIARSVLEKVFLDCEGRAELVESAIARRLKTLDAASVLAIRVSSEDFGGEEELARLRGAIGRGAELVADPALGAGACIFDLKLGHLEIGPGAQWQRVAQLLASLEQEGVEP